jgi:hypothetical protein
MVDWYDKSILTAQRLVFQKHYKRASTPSLVSCVDTLFSQCTNTGVHQRELPVSHTLACWHSLSLIDLERNLKF